MITTGAPSGWHANRPAARSTEKSHVREILANRNDVIIIKTSPGIATMIKLGAHPMPAIIGDSASFKLEYLEDGVTIRPMRAGVQTNLYLFSEVAQFNLQLRTVGRNEADYIVYLKREPEKAGGAEIPRQPPVIIAKENAEYVFKIINVFRAANKNIAMDFQITAKREIVVNPTWFFLTRMGKIIPVEQLEIGKTNLNQGETAVGRILLTATSVLGVHPLRLEIRSPEPLIIPMEGIKKWLRQ